MDKRKDWKTAFWKAWDKLGVLGTLVSFIPSIIAFILNIIEKPKSFTSVQWGDIMNLIGIWLASYFVIIIVGTLWYLNRKSVKLVDVVNQETKEPRLFFTMAEHAECVVKNANAETVAKYLLQKYKEISRYLEYKDVTYFVDGGTFYDPKKHGTLQYAIVANGLKETRTHKYAIVGRVILVADPSMEPMEMFTITISQGGENTSRVTFDTDTREIYSAFSKNIFQDLRDAFKIGKVKR